ncbi:MAG TPA: DinB family protein, partial [Anaerolineaceae bacterium]
EVNIPRIEKLTAEDSPFIAGINTDNWAGERDYLHQDGQAALNGFVTSRTQLIERVESLPESNWQRIARHAIFGPTTMQELVGFTTTHDRTHIQQIQAAARTLAGKAA